MKEEQNEEQLEDEEPELEEDEEGLDHDGIARVCHDAVAALARSFGDPSYVPWDQESDEERDVFVARVRSAVDHPELSAEGQHGAWMGRKLAEGWRKGAVRDPGRKVHHALVPYAELRPEQRAEGEIIRAIALALAETTPAERTGV